MVDRIRRRDFQRIHGEGEQDRRGLPSRSPKARVTIAGFLRKVSTALNLGRRIRFADVFVEARFCNDNGAFMKSSFLHAFTRTIFVHTNERTGTITH